MEKQCAAWGCFSRGLIDKDGEKVTSGITFFKFPNDKDLKKLWCSRIKRVDGRDNFKVTKSTVLCDKHFHTDDIIRPCGGTRKRLKKDAKPFLTSEDIELSSSTKRKEPTF